MLEEIIQNRYAVTAVILFGIGFTNLMPVSYTHLTLPSTSRRQRQMWIRDSINPLPSGLVLTGIVVSVSITAFSLALIQRIYRRYGTIEMRELLERAKKEDD